MLRYEIYGVKYNNELVYVGKTQYGMPKRRGKHKYETAKILNINPKYISKCLHGDIKKTQGYIFRYIEGGGIND